MGVATLDELAVINGSTIGRSKKPDQNYYIDISSGKTNQINDMSSSSTMKLQRKSKKD